MTSLADILTAPDEDWYKKMDRVVAYDRQHPEVREEWRATIKGWLLDEGKRFTALELCDRLQCIEAGEQILALLKCDPALSVAEINAAILALGSVGYAPAEALVSSFAGKEVHYNPSILSLYKLNPPRALEVHKGKYSQIKNYAEWLNWCCVTGILLEASYQKTTNVEDVLLAIPFAAELRQAVSIYPLADEVKRQVTEFLTQQGKS